MSFACRAAAEMMAWSDSAYEAEHWASEGEEYCAWFVACESRPRLEMAALYTLLWLLEEDDD